MNNKSIAYVNKTTQEPSWKDDPFDLKGSPGFSQGVTRMSPQRELELYAEELVARYAITEDDVYYLHLTDLPDHEQSELTRLFLESIDREMESEAIHGENFDINNDYNCALLALLKNDNRETRRTLADVTRRNITIYYTDSLQETLDSACESYADYMHQETNMRWERDLDHGDYNLVSGY